MQHNGVLKEFNTHIRNYDYEVVCGGSPADASYPAVYEIPRDNTGTLKNQGNIGCCVAETIAQIAESFYKTEMAEGWVYGKFRKPSSNGWGMYVSAAMDYWMEIGTVPKTYFDILKEMPDMKEIANKFDDLQKQAEKYQLKAYAELNYADKTKRDNAIKDALMKSGRGLVAVSHDYFNESHCIVLTGWNDETGKYKFKNSWGETYGDKGFSEIPKNKINEVYYPIFEDIALPFSDVKDTDWFYKDVKNMFFAGLIGGYEDGTFKPNNQITRAEVCVILNRLTKMIDERFDILNRVLEEKFKMVDGVKM